MTPNFCPSVSAVRMPDSEIPSTGFLVASRSECSPGSL